MNQTTNRVLNDSQLLALFLRSGQSQRKFAKSLGMNFNSFHGRIFREQKRIQGLQEAPKPAMANPMTFSAAVFDIETTSFGTAGVRDHLICTSIKPLGGEITTIKISFEDKRDDQRVLQETWEALSKHDILIGHNIASYDFNWLYSRTLYHKLPDPSKRWLYYDTLVAARRIAVKTYKSLEMLIDYFQLEGEKTRILPVAWGNIDSPNKGTFEKALSDIVYHCERDVEANEELFYVLWPRDRKAKNLPFTQKW